MGHQKRFSTLLHLFLEINNKMMSLKASLHSMHNSNCDTNSINFQLRSISCSHVVSHSVTVIITGPSRPNQAYTIYPNLSKPIQTYPNQNISEYIRIYQNISEYIRIYQNISEYIKVKHLMQLSISTLVLHVPYHTNKNPRHNVYQFSILLNNHQSHEHISIQG